MSGSTARAASTAVTDEDRHALVLRAWEAVNTQRTLPGVLATIADLLTPRIPFDAVAIVGVDGPEGRSRPYALHVVDQTSTGISPQAMRGDCPPAGPALTVARPPRPIVDSPLKAHLRAGLPHVVDDLLLEPAWYPHEQRLAAMGMRVYASLPLIVSGTWLGAIAFVRRAPRPYQADEITIFTDVSRGLAVAVANALANDEVGRLRETLEAENLSLRSELARSHQFEEIVGNAPAIRRSLAAVEQVAGTDATVLVLGETGTGKELIARAVHRLSARAKGPLVTVNCAALPPTLIAAELFGHERGAFTGAVERRTGRFEDAQGGTLFLDEIGELPLPAQTVLLRVLQERAFERVGGNRTIEVDVRVVAATNRDLEDEVRAGRFRSDLYYRLSVFPVRLPPLRERAEDIALLAAHFADRYGARYQRPIKRIHKQTARLLQAHPWPGNIRQLENVIARAVILAHDGVLRVDRESLGDAAAPDDMDAALRDRERAAIEAALTQSQGRVSGARGAARRLGLPASTLEFRIRRLGIEKWRYRSAAPPPRRC